ncbi:MAG TPA: zinc-dependent metalloprotease, partial [Pirellulales bacterium]
HWGMNETTRLDYPVHEVILMWQERVLNQLLSTLTLERLHDAELKVAADADAITTAELLDRLTKAIFSETETVGAGQYTDRKPAISSLRRNLQRAYLKQLSSLVLEQTGAPEDCRTIAYMQLVDLQGRLKVFVVKEGVQFDAYTRAHLHETIERIGKIIDARVNVSGF